MSQNNASSSIWTPANVVTCARILFVPVFFVLMLYPFSGSLAFWQPWIAAVTFALISATDAVDGYLARSRGEVTDFGKFVDPLADKILVIAALLALTELGTLPSWIPLVIVTREFIISGVRMLAASKGRVIAASWYGKAKTMVTMIAIIMFIVMGSPVFPEAIGPISQPMVLLSWIVMIAAVILTIVSMVDYVAKAKDVIGLG